MRVLVIDDDANVRRLLEVGLAHYGYAVTAIGNGEEAARIFSANPSLYRAVLLDIQMPGMDGPHTLDALSLVDPEVRAVFITANMGRYSPTELRRRGASRSLSR